MDMRERGQSRVLGVEVEELMQRVLRILIRIHDSAKAKKRDQGLLGEVSLKTLGEYLGPGVIGQGMYRATLWGAF
jgi:hypothetical protein